MLLAVFPNFLNQKKPAIFIKNAYNPCPHLMIRVLILSHPRRLATSDHVRMYQMATIVADNLQVSLPASWLVNFVKLDDLPGSIPYSRQTLRQHGMQGWSRHLASDGISLIYYPLFCGPTGEKQGQSRPLLETNSCLLTAQI